MLFDLAQRQVHELHRVLDLEAPRVIFFRGEQAEEDGFEAALADASQVHLAVFIGVCDISTQVELAIDHVDVAVHHEGLVMQAWRLCKTASKETDARYQRARLDHRRRNDRKIAAPITLPNIIKNVDGSGTTVPLRENAML